MTTTRPLCHPWEKSGIRGQKPPLKRQQICAIRIRLEMDGRLRDLALFNLAIDSKLRACDLVSLRVSDVVQGGKVAQRACVMQQKTGRRGQFELTEPTREAVADWLQYAELRSGDCLLPSRFRRFPHLSTRQYARILKSWVAMLGLDPCEYGTHSMRRTKASLIYRRTKNIRAVQLLLGHTKLESTIR